MQQVILSGHYSILQTSAGAYNLVAGGKVWDVTLYKQLIPTSGKLKNFRVEITQGPGVGQTRTFALVVSGGGGLSVDIAGANTNGNDPGEIAVAAGDYVYIHMTTAPGVPTGCYAQWSVMFEGDTAKESILIGGTANELSTTVTEFENVVGCLERWRDTEAYFYQVIPTSGKIKKLYVLLNIDPGTAPDAYRFTLRVNGANSDDGGGNPLQVTITADNITGNDVAHEIPVSAGDVIDIMCEPLNTPSVAPHACWGMVFEADTDGESCIINGSMTDLANYRTQQYLQPNGVNEAWSGTETERQQLGQVMTIKKLYVVLEVAPGDTKSWIFRLRNNVGDTVLTCTIANLATTCNDVANEVVINDDDNLSMEVEKVGSPTSGMAYFGMVGYLAPAAGWTGKISGVTNPAKIMGVDVANIASVKGVV